MSVQQQQVSSQRQQQQTKHAISLKGSAEIVCNYLRYSINSILYQRGIYPSESFKVQHQYDIPIFVSEDAEVRQFLDRLLAQNERWLLDAKVRRLSLIIANVQSKEVIECWEFNLEYEGGDAALTAENKAPTGGKELKRIQQEIRDVMRQISATVSYLPLLDCRCSFDVIVHAADDCAVPDEWNDAAPIRIANSQNVKLKSFSTSLHRMETVVNYKMED